MTKHVPEPGTADATGIEAADGRRPHGFVDAGYGGVLEAAHAAPQSWRCAKVAMHASSMIMIRRVGFAYLGNQMGGYRDARAREVTAVLHAAIGL